MDVVLVICWLLFWIGIVGLFIQWMLYCISDFLFVVIFHLACRWCCLSVLYCIKYTVVIIDTMNRVYCLAILCCEFSGVKRSFIPIQAIIRIDEVEREGHGKIKEVKSTDKIANFPLNDRFIPKPSPPKKDN